MEISKIRLYRRPRCIFQNQGRLRVRPQYYAYSLLTRFVRQGDEVYPLDLGDELIAGSAFLKHRGKMDVCTFQRYRQRQDDTVGK